MKRMTQEREERGWSRFELGAKARVHPARIGQIESGRVVPYPVELKRIGVVLEVEDPTSLLEEVGSQ